MRRYSAAEAIGPAWEHAKEWLFRNAGLFTYLKLAAVASLAGFATISLNYNSKGFDRERFDRLSAGNPAMQHMPHLGLLLLVPIILVIAVLVLVFMYFSARMGFVLLNALATRRRQIGPIWALYREPALSWYLLMIVLMAISSAVFLPVLLGARHISTIPFALRTGALLLISLCMAIVWWILRDFVMPIVALEGTNISTGWSRAVDTFRAEPGAFAIYFLLKLVVTFLLAIARVIALVVGYVLMAIPFIIVSIIVMVPTRHGSVGALIVAIPVLLLLGLLSIACGAVIFFAISGPMSAFLASWSLYFYGGRYPLLGEMLEPSVAVPTFTPPPSFPGDDSTSGPDLPLNPQPIS